MSTRKLLILTDHATHTAENSVYELARALLQHPDCGGVDVASRSVQANHAFFHEQRGERPWVSAVTTDFSYTHDERHFAPVALADPLTDYVAILLRLPAPTPAAFWVHLRALFPEQRMINQPTGVEETGSKAFLLNFPDICPALGLCHTVADIEHYAAQQPIVLKPLRSYGGKGIVRIQDGVAWLGSQAQPLEQWLATLHDQPVQYLAMEYLHQVTAGDKRIVVVGDQILGAVLRLPPPGSWLCNSSQGGQAVTSQADAEEIAIVARILPALQARGIVMFGIDTLLGNDNRRKLSEINTTSIGGLTPIGLLSGQPVVERAADLLCQHIKNLL